jgi:hypothetical protein
MPEYPFAGINNAAIVIAGITLSLRQKKMPE